MPMRSGFSAAVRCDRACAPATDVAASTAAIPIAMPMRVLVTVSPFGFRRVSLIVRQWAMIRMAGGPVKTVKFGVASGDLLF